MEIMLKEQQISHHHRVITQIYELLQISHCIHGHQTQNLTTHVFLVNVVFGIAAYQSLYRDYYGKKVELLQILRPYRWSFCQTHGTI